MTRSVLVIGIGNELRGDDRAGLEVVRRLSAGGLPDSVRVRELAGEALDLLDFLSDVDAVIVIDTAHSGAPAGTIHRVDAGAQPLPAQLKHASSHTISIAEAIELARSLGQLPSNVIVFGIEGRQFDAGAPWSVEVERAAHRVIEAVRSEALALSRPVPARRF